jgi:hypothetical protein
MPQHDDGQDDVSALTFFNTNQTASDDDSSADRQALVFSVPGDQSAQESAVDALRAQAADELQDASTGLDALRPDVAADNPLADEASPFLVKVTNPPGTVSVRALADGSVLEIELSPKVANMTESALADEILVIADLARQKGLANQQAFITDATQALGIAEGDAAHGFIADSLELPTPQQAEAAQAEVFATRYAADTD